MQYILVAALTFGVMFLLDKGFTKLFRSKEQHKSGLAVRLKKGYGVAGILLCVLAVVVLLQYITGGEKMMLFCFVVLLIMGAGLLVYYMTFGVFYDDEGFVLSTFGRKSAAYRYADIENQKLYVITGGSNVVELYLSDGNTVSLQSTMEGVYPFLDKACHARFRQLGINSHECGWFDEGQSCWFPPKED